MRSLIRKISKVIGLVSLLVLIIPSFLFLIGNYSLNQVKWIMLGATIVWFISATIWMNDR